MQILKAFRSVSGHQFCVVNLNMPSAFYSSLPTADKNLLLPPLNGSRLLIGHTLSAHFWHYIVRRHSNKWTKMKTTLTCLRNRIKGAPIPALMPLELHILPKGLSNHGMSCHSEHQIRTSSHNFTSFHLIKLSSPLWWTLVHCTLIVHRKLESTMHFSNYVRKKNKIFCHLFVPNVGSRCVVYYLFHGGHVH
jgi:hypothetical protein